MIAKYGLYLKVEKYGADYITNFIPITEELEETIISELGIWEEGKFTIISVTHSQNKNDETSSAAVWNPKSFDNTTTVGQFAVYSLMEAIEDRISFKKNIPVPEGEEVLHQLENVEAKALPILEDLIGSERLSEVKKRMESVTFPTEIRQIVLEELNLFLEERKSKRI